MKIAYLQVRFPEPVSAFIIREVRKMRELGAEISVYSLKSPCSELPADYQDLSTITHSSPFFLSFSLIAANLRFFSRMPFRYLKTLIRLAIFTLKNPRIFIKSLAIFPKSIYFAEIMEKEGVEYIHASWASLPATSAWIVLSMTDIPYSFSAHVYDLYSTSVFLKQKLSGCGFVSCISRANKEYLDAKFPQYRHKTKVVHLGVDPSEFSIKDHRKADEDNPKIITIGRLIETKGFDYMIQAMPVILKSFPKATLTIAGSGPEQEKLQSMINCLNVNASVKLAGHVDMHELKKILGDGDLFVLPSGVEGIPVSLMEAMASGLPVITTSAGSIRELVDDGASGILIPYGDADAIAEAVHKLASEPKTREYMGKRGRRKIQNDFNLEKNTVKLFELISSLAKH